MLQQAIYATLNSLNAFSPVWATLISPSHDHFDQHKSNSDEFKTLPLLDIYQHDATIK